MTGALWAAASGIGFGLFQSLNRRALRDLDDAFVSTFLQLAVAGGGRVRFSDAVFGLGCALMWAISPVFAVEGLEGVRSPLLGVAIGLVAAAVAYAVALTARGSGLGLAEVAHSALWLKLVAALFVAFATWWRWIALDDAAVGVVLALGLLSVPVVLFLAPVLVGAHVEHVTPRVWAGSALVAGGALTLILVG